MREYVAKEKDGRIIFSEARILQEPSSLKIIDHPLRTKILKLLSKNPMYPAEIAKKLNIHEQKIYYHIKQMVNAGLVEVVEKEEIRGTVAKKFSPTCLNFAITLSDKWKEYDEIIEQKSSKIVQFFSPFIKNNIIDASIIVGSPDPHGPYKARARDGHYAIDLSLFLGGLCRPGAEFTTKLDVDAALDAEENLIVVGGPVTNILASKINDFLPAKFSDKKPWGIKTKKKNYTDDTIGLVAKIPNPYHNQYSILLFAGIRFIGTKAAVLALTRYPDLMLSRFSSQEKFFSIVQGFDMDADGKIDAVELLE